MKAAYYYYYFRPIKTTLFPFPFIQKHFLLKLSSSSSAADAVILSPLPTTTPNSSSSFTVQFLVNSCGLSFKSAVSISQKLRLHENNIHKTQAVLHFLKSHHFDDTQIASLIKKRPSYLHSRVEDNLKPKFEFLIANGFSGNLLSQLILSNPCISERSLDSHIKPSFEFLRSYLNSNENIMVAVKRFSWFLTINLKVVMQPNVDFLIKEGVPLYGVAKLMLKNPRAMQFKHDRMVYAVNYVKNLGFLPKSPMFIHALARKMALSESSWKKKIEVMKCYGWSEGEILGAFKRNPSIFSFSEEKIRRGVDFFISTLKLHPQAIIARSQLLNYSIDRRLRPRHNVLEFLVSEKLIFKEDMQNVHWLFFMSEQNFLRRYVTKYADTAPGLLDIYGVTSKAKR